MQMHEGETKRDYCERRAAEERAAAVHAVDERAAQAHRELAAHFDALASDPSKDIAAMDSAQLSSTLPSEFRIIP